MRQAFEKPTTKKPAPDIEKDLGYDDVLKVLKDGPAKDRTKVLLTYDDTAFLKGLLTYLGPSIVPYNKMNNALKKRLTSIKKKKNAPEELIGQVQSVLEKQKEYHSENSTEKPPVKSKWNEIEDKAKEMMTKQELPEEEKKRRMEIYKNIKQEKAFDLAYRLFKKNLLAESERLIKIVVAYEKPESTTYDYFQERKKKEEADQAEKDKHFPRKNPFKSDKERDEWLDSITGKPNPNESEEERKKRIDSLISGKPEAKVETPKKVAPKKTAPKKIEPKQEAPKEQAPPKKPKLTIQPVRVSEPEAKPKKKSKIENLEDTIRQLEQARDKSTNPEARAELQQFIDEESVTLEKERKKLDEQKSSR